MKVSFRLLAVTCRHCSERLDVFGDSVTVFLAGQVEGARAAREE